MSDNIFDHHPDCAWLYSLPASTPCNCTRLYRKRIAELEPVVEAARKHLRSMAHHPCPDSSREELYVALHKLDGGGS